MQIVMNFDTHKFVEKPFSENRSLPICDDCDEVCTRRM